MTDDDNEWDDLIDDEPEIDDLELQIAQAEINLAILKTVRAMRELAKACTAAAESFHTLADNHVLNSEVVDDLPARSRV